MATPEVVEQVRKACVARLFSGRDDASWEAIRQALQKLEGMAEEVVCRPVHARGG